MNRTVNLTWLVTHWEFNRFFKLSDLIKGTLFFLIMGVIGGLVGLVMGRDAVSVPDIAVQDYGEFAPAALVSERLSFIDASDQDIDTLQQQLEAGDIDGVLIVDSADQGQLMTTGERPWQVVLNEFLAQVRTDFLLEQLDISDETYALLNRGFEVESRYLVESRASRVDKVVAGIAVLLVVMAVFMGFAYQFTAITAEKQQRITEQVISAISPQTWMDGKILGISGIGLAYVVYYGLLGLVVTAVLTWLGMPLGEVLALIDLPMLAVFIVMALLGILMWNAFLAAIAAVIDDPNTSQKSGWMMLPMVPVGFAFFALVNPDNLLMKILGIFPLTSSAVLPARMVLTEVAWWEILLAVVTLAGAAWLLRIAAGRIFAAGMMMYGKEPGLREMLYWVRRGRP
ncbi:ABC transporter permease [Wenzhouxiangella sp. AB-CW3]|uniref:ABC transporter permease n=1 Tax=Wenzhouxiangella sp. AB-CW3 TaxID=2771012 RepID=UPI00168AF02F|nr:ABC transporter permease [Wenzhouxiangella sp. AB-CW3]QOC23224.1 ABC transporter permease [Wenzhouxiangella sp. AB-CW3]